MAGIYFHIPYCKQACTYCDFHFSVNSRNKGEMVQALVQEMAMRKDFFGDSEEVETLYFGGGTPSLLEEAELNSLLDAAHRHFTISSKAEVTIECNPDDLNPRKLQEIYKAGVNRLSIGLQSFRDEDLQLMNRSHTAKQSLQSVRDAQDAGFENITIDLIYGIPNMSQAEWEAALEQAIALETRHISAYALTVEKKTVLDHQVRTGKVILPEDNAFEANYFAMVDRLENAGFEHYEISNFGKPGYHSRHNSAYWQGKPYLGIGPSAHSFRHPSRQWNIANNARYLKALRLGESPVEESEELSQRDLLNEYLMTQLRLKQGLGLQKMRDEFDFDLLKAEGAKVAEYLQEGWLEKNEERLWLSKKGKLLSDRIIREFFQVEDTG